MPKVCAWPDCGLTGSGTAKRGWFCSIKGHDKADVGAWIVAVRLPEAAASVLRNSATDTADLRELTEEDVKELGLKAIVDRRLRKHLRRLGNDSVREGSRLSSAAKPPQSPQAPPATVMVEAIPENADKMNAPVQHMVFGGADVYFGRLEAIILPQMLQHSIEEECTLNDGGKWADEYYYVTTMRSVETPILEKIVVRDKGHQGFTLEQYCGMDAAKGANLNPARRLLYSHKHRPHPPPRALYLHSR
jgi:hypothetical protein